MVEEDEPNKQDRKWKEGGEEDRDEEKSRKYNL